MNINFQREQWAKSFFEEPIKTELWKLDEKGKVAMFLTKEKISCGNDDLQGRSPLFHVWNGDRRIITTSVCQEAYRVFMNELACTAT